MDVTEAAGRPSPVAFLPICWLVCLCQPPMSPSSRRAHLISAHALHDGWVVCMRLSLPREPRSKGRPELIPASSSPNSLRAQQSCHADQLVSHSPDSLRTLQRCQADQQVSHSPGAQG